MAPASTTSGRRSRDFPCPGPPTHLPAFGSYTDPWVLHTNRLPSPVKKSLSSRSNVIGRCTHRFTNATSSPRKFARNASVFRPFASNVNLFVAPGGNSSTRASEILWLLTTVSLDRATGFDKCLRRQFDTLPPTRYDV